MPVPPPSPEYEPQGGSKNHADGAGLLAELSNDTFPEYPSEMLAFNTTKFLEFCK